MNQSETRMYLWAAGFYALLVLVFCFPVLQGQIITQTDYLNFISPWDAVKPAALSDPSNPFLQDQSLEFLPFFLEAKSQLTAGMFPLWNPYIFAGNPLWANTQSALLFPLNFFHYFLDAPLGFTISSLFKLFFGCFLTHLFVRKLNMGHGPALLAGVAFGFCSFTVFWLNHPHTNVTPMIPLCFYMVERLLDKTDTRNMMLYALVVALSLIAGHVEIAFLTAAACGMFYLLRLWQLKRLSWAPLFKFFMIYVYALLLSAILVIPFIEFLFNTAIWSERGDAVLNSVPTAGLISLFMSDFFIFDGWAPRNIGFHAFSPYVGLVTLPLAVYAVFKSFNKSWPLMLVCLLSIAVAFTVNPFNWLVKNLPLFNHLPLFYFNVLAAFSLSVLAAIGLQQCLKHDRDSSRLLAVLLVVLVFVLTIRFWWNPGGLTPYVLDAELLLETVRQMSLWVAMTWLLVWLLMFFAKQIPAFVLVGLLVGLVYADLWQTGHDWNPAIEVEYAVPRDQPGALKFLADQTVPFRAVGHDKIMTPSTNMLARVHDVRGYDVPVIDRYHQFFNRALKGQDAFWFYDLPKYDPSIWPYLNILNTRFVLTKTVLEEPLPEHLRVVYQDEINIYENDQAMGLAFMPTGVEYVDSPEAALERVLSLESKLKDVVVIEPKDSRFEKNQSSGLTDNRHEITYQNIAANQIDLQVTSQQAAWLVLSQSYYPGWHAYIDGEETDIFAANFVLQAIKIPAGSHQVVFKYCPLSFTLGWLVSLFSFIFALWKIRKTK